MSNLLINEPPLQVLPSLANIIGLNEAIVLQQLHYLLAFATTEHDGRKWVYNSIENWQKEHFPFWGEKTIRRAMDRLTELGLIVCEKLQERTRNQTKFYTIDYKKLDEIQTKPICQNGQMELVKMTNSIRSKRPDGTGQNDQMSVGQNDQMLQENTNRIHTTEYIQESESTPTHAKPPDKKFLSADDLINLDVDGQVAHDYLATRKTKLTQTALNGIVKQASQAGLTLSQAIEFAVESGWQSFKADWYQNQQKPLANNHQPSQVHDFTQYLNLNPAIPPADGVVIDGEYA